MPRSVATDRRPTRLAEFRRQLLEGGLDGYLVAHLPNIRYLTGFTGSTALLLVDARRAILITDFRYSVQAAEESGEVCEIEIDQVSLWDRLKRVAQGLQGAVLGFERDHMIVRDAERLSQLEVARVVPSPDLVAGRRVSKDAEEVEAIRSAATLAHEALDEVLLTVRIGETEVAIAARLEAALRVRGSQWHPFQTIVASGPRAALPHARTTTRAVASGDWLLLDFGAYVDGYCSDITRTVVVGRPADTRQREIYTLVQRAQRAALDGIRAGMSGRAADGLAREVIVSQGFGSAFGHSLGHGIGLEVHEGPRLSPVADGTLPTHAVVTIEPGIYLPGWGGVRIEDDVYLGPAGPELLTDGKTELLELH